MIEVAGDEPPVVPETDAAGAYLDLLARCLTGSLQPDGYEPIQFSGRRARLFSPLQGALRDRGIELARHTHATPAMLERGIGSAQGAETMIGLRRLQNIRTCVTDAIARGVPGDLIETGVWRGGATIFMRGILKALGDAERRVWVADSFAGLPPPDAARWPADAGDSHWTRPHLAVGAAEVRRNFERYGLLDDQVQFLEGYFEDTLEVAPIDRLAVLRLDGDMYGSTMVTLRALYPKLSAGGYVIVDDYGALLSCRQAVEDYRAEHGIEDPIEAIDWTGVYWRKGTDAAV
jgi:O-methyltransferase